MTAGPAVGLVGLGLVGTALAERLLAAGHAVHGCDSDPARARALAASGVTVVDTPRQVAAAAPTVVLSLPDGDALRAVVDGADGLLTGTPAMTLLIDTTTADPEDLDELAPRLAERGVGLLDATISGSSEQVRAGQAVWMVGGSEADLQRAAPVLDAFGGRRRHLGPTGAGRRAKLASNLVLGLNRLALAEGLLLAEGLGLEPARFLELLVETPAYSRQMDTKGPRMVEGRFAPPAARLAQHRKDVGLILEAARGAGVQLPTSALHARLLDAALEAGDGELDNSAILRQLRRATPGAR